jgi:hypothetical protein
MFIIIIIIIICLNDETVTYLPISVMFLVCMLFHRELHNVQVFGELKNLVTTALDSGQYGT